MRERVKLIAELGEGFFSMTELSRRYGISRKTGYKWLERFEREGPEGLKDRSRVPKSSPSRTQAEIVEELLLVRRRHPTWGPKKLIAWLWDHRSDQPWPAASTAGEILKRHGLVRARPWRRRLEHPGRTAYPAVPFASVAIGRLSALSVWWMRLGIQPILIEPAHPEQNASHERMHRTLKQETTRPPQANLSAQQRRFDRFRREYNEQRPHESLRQKPPATVYQPSHRSYPQRPPMEYPGHFEIRRVGYQWLHLTQALHDQDVGLEEIDDGIWSVYFGPMLLGRFHLDDLRVYAVPS